MTHRQAVQSLKYMLAQVLACLMSLVGIFIATHLPTSHTGHRSLGIVCQALLGIQVSTKWLTMTHQMTICLHTQALADYRHLLLSNGTVLQEGTMNFNKALPHTYPSK